MESSVQDMKDCLAEAREKYRKVLVSNAQLHDDKAALTYQVEMLQEELSYTEELLWETWRRSIECAKALEHQKELYHVAKMERDQMRAEKGGGSGGTGLDQAEEAAGRHGSCIPAVTSCVSSMVLHGPSRTKYMCAGELMGVSKRSRRKAVAGRKMTLNGRGKRQAVKQSGTSEDEWAFLPGVISPTESQEEHPKYRSDVSPGRDVILEHQTVLSRSSVDRRHVSTALSHQHENEEHKELPASAEHSRAWPRASHSPGRTGNQTSTRTTESVQDKDPPAMHRKEPTGDSSEAIGPANRRSTDFDSYFAPKDFLPGHQTSPAVGRRDKLKAFFRVLAAPEGPLINVREGKRLGERRSSRLNVQALRDPLEGDVDSCEEAGEETEDAHLAAVTSGHTVPVRVKAAVTSFSRTDGASLGRNMS
uniref:leucine-rich repeat flightless-interacting protein 1-like isoform X2 n=1 Tax=Doryrhamphus excisus TaxID=161450 RepID=UPI0025AE86C1|nr:leucine-rich repeat flightless-interacting protein 1-like isoform X2 [Doryrhamphus excisus]